MLEVLEKCPVCQTGKFVDELTCKDHTVSNETFRLSRCTNCSFLFTNPRPNRAELGKYYQSDDYVSHQNKANSLINLVYKFARHFTLKSKVHLINKLQNVGRLLDIGCGTGHFLQYAALAGWNITGMEPDRTARQQAQDILNTSVYPSITDLEGEKFNVITLWHVLEHVPNLNQYVISLSKLLAPNGTIIVAVPNHKSLDAQHYKAYWAGYDVPRHLYHFSQDTMHQLMSRHHLKITSILPMKLDAFYVSLLSEKYLGNGIKGLVYSFINSLKSNSYASKNNNEYSSLIYIIRSK